MIGFGGIEIGARAVSTGVGGWRYVSAVKDVTFFDLGGVEKGWETHGVEKADDGGVWGHEGARRHVASEDGGLVFVDSGREVVDLALGVEVAEAIFDGPEKWEAAFAGDFSGR